MQLVRYDSFDDLLGFDQDFENLYQHGANLAQGISEPLPLDMYAEGGKLITKVMLPNFTKQEIKVTTDKNVIEIRAEHKEKSEDKTKQRYYFHASSNQYMRRISLPEGAKTANVEAEFNNGLLTITMPYEAKQLPKAVDVK